MKAIFNDHVIAEAPKEELIYIEGNWYFPLTSVKQEYLEKSDTPYTCPWKGECQYYNVKVDSQESKDSVFGYPNPLPGALDKVKKDFSQHVAFWRDIQVTE